MTDLEAELAQLQRWNRERNAELCAQLARERAEAAARILALEERVAFAEQARDNAVTQREDVIRRSKQKSETAGQIIAHLAKLVRICSQLIPKEEMRAEVLRLMDTILADNSAKV